MASTGKALLVLRDEDGAHVHAVPPPVVGVPIDVAPDGWRAWKPVVIRGLGANTNTNTSTSTSTGRRIVALGLVSRTILIDADTQALIAELGQSAEEVAFSPKATYVSTWRTGAFAERRPAAAPGSAARGTTVDFRLSDPAMAGQMQTIRAVFSRGDTAETVGEPDPTASAAASSGGAEDKENLSVWRVSDGALLASFSQRNRENWAPQWTDDERICVRTVTNTVQIFRDGDFKNGRSTLTIERVGAVALAPTGGARPLLAAFVPESKGAPATVKLVSLNENNAVVASKTFFQAREARMHWSPTGTDVVVDASIQNASSLYLVSEQAAVRIELPSSYVHDVAWSPDGRSFVLVHGPPTAKTAWLLDRRGQRTADLGGNNTSRSMASFSRSGDRLLLAGLYGSDNIVELYQGVGSGKPTLILSKVVGSLAVCALLDARGTLVLAAGTDRFPSQNGYRIYDDKGTVVAEFSCRALKSCTPVLASGSGAGAGAAAGAGAGAGTAAGAGGAPAVAGVSRDELEKRLKAVAKKLKQLDPLKEKQRLGMVLEDNQIVKLSSENAWNEEVALLTAQLASL